MSGGQSETNQKVSIHSLMRAAYGAFAASALFSFAVNLLMLTLPLFMFQVFDRVLASRSTAEGPGIVYAEVTPGTGEPVIAPEADRFWVPELPLFLKAYWHQQNVAGRSAYRRYGRARGLEAAERNSAL